MTQRRRCLRQLRRLRPASFAAALAVAGALLAGCAAQPSPQDGRAYFADLERRLLEAGRLKSDRLARDVSVSAAALAENFRLTAFGEEFAIRDGRTVSPPPASQARLRRWEGPVRWRLTGRIAAADRAAMAELSAKLAPLIGRELAEIAPGGEPRLEIQVLDAVDRAALAAAFRTSRADSQLAELFLAWAASPRWPCASEIYFQRAGAAGAFEIAFAIIYIRDELTGLSRRACFEEEVAQSLGLARDDSRVRPSIFNDDEEYALLTRHDERLLEMLYDGRLRPGMGQSDAMPIVRRLAAEMVERP